jgi:hypothetical protein
MALDNTGIKQPPRSTGRLPNQRRSDIMRTVNFLTDQEIFDRAVAHLHGQRCAALLPKGGAAYRGSCGGCPIGSVIRPADYASAMEGVPVRYLRGPALGRPSFMDAGIAALRKALLRARINVYDDRTVSLLSCLQNVHDAFGVWEWCDRLLSIAREYGLSSECMRLAA